MRLKEIKPGMVIHCNTGEEFQRLEEETIRLGLGELPVHFKNKADCSDFLFYITENDVLWSGLEIACYIEFSEIVIPELPAEPEFEWVDVCRILGGHSIESVYEERLSSEYSFTKEEQVQEILKKYIAEHEGNYIAVIERVCRVKE